MALSWQGGLSGAGTGAAVGSWGGPWGTAIGAGAGFLGGLFTGGGDDKPDEEKFDANKTALTTTKGLEGQAKKLGAKSNELGGMSSEALSPVLQYFQKIASGDPGALMAATQPERGRVIDQYDSARKSAAMAAPRGGGTTSAIVNSYISEANQLSDLTATAHREGNTTLANLGVNLAGLGLSADQLASASLDSIMQAVFHQQSIDAQKRGQNMAMLGDFGEAAGGIIGIILGKNKTTGGGGGLNFGSEVENVGEI